MQKAALSLQKLWAYIRVYHKYHDGKLPFPIFCLEWDDCSTLNDNAIDFSANRLDLYHQAAFDMRHKILMTLQKLPEAADVCLGEVDETYVLDYYKSRKLDAEARRRPRKHGVKASKEVF